MHAMETVILQTTFTKSSQNLQLQLLYQIANVVS